jgi:hypothetical protein
MIAVSNVVPIVACILYPAVSTVSPLEVISILSWAQYATEYFALKRILVVILNRPVFGNSASA